MKTISNRIGIALISLFFLSSCGGTKLSNGWINKADEGRYLKNVLVVATSDQFEKERFEDTFARHFRDHGVKAVSLASATKKKKLTTAEVKAEAAKLGMDTIFTVRIVSIDEKAVTDRFAPPPEASPDWSYSHPIYTVQTPPMSYKFEEKDVVMESNLYDASTGKVIWKVRSKTVKRGATSELIDEVAGAVMKDLSANKLLK